MGVDPRKATIKRSGIDAPKVGRAARRRRPAPIEAVRRRKAKASIMQERSKRDQELMRYRPPLTRPVATDTNKRYLQAQFQFKGGKALPEAGLLQPVEGNLPMTLITGKRPARRSRRAVEGPTSEGTGGARGRASGTNEPLEDGPAVSAAAKKIARCEEEFEHVMNEIEERKAFLDEMLEEHGSRTHAKYRDQIEAEISGLVRQAQKLDKQIRSLQ